MSGPREVGVRTTLFVCGLVSVLIAGAYRGLGMFFPANHHAWIVISGLLMVAGIINAVAAIVPPSFVRRLFRSTQRTWLQLPFRLLAGFFVASYAAVAALSVLSPSAQVCPLIVYVLCPSCVSIITVDPSLPTLLLLLAPTSAAAYGTVGALIGLVIDAIRR